MVTIPFNYTARDYQLEYLREMQRAIEGRSNKRFFVRVWHRRSGKDKTTIADPIPRRLIKDPCLVKYVYPTLVMARDNMWDAMGSDGFKYINHIPEEIRASKPNNTRMTIPIVGGSLFQLAGSDDPDSLRGGNPKFYGFSEWAEQNPYAFDVIEPILRENGGIADFNFTPKGDNHAKALVEFAKNHPSWYVQVLTVHDTGIFTGEQLEQIQKDIIDRFIADGRSEEEAIAFYQQEYECSFDSPVIGSYYGAAIRRAEQENRITRVPYDTSLPVDTYWDLGVNDTTDVWFFQQAGLEIRIIDFLEGSGEGLPYYANKLRERGYSYGRHVAPHDIKVRELGSGRSRLDIAKDLGINFEVAPLRDVDDGIEAVRSLFSRFWIDAEKCKRGISALKSYHKVWDEKNKVFKDRPMHDWASNAADALRTFGNAFRETGQIGGGRVTKTVNARHPKMPSTLVTNDGKYVIPLDFRGAYAKRRPLR